MVWVTNGLDCPNITFIDPVLDYAGSLFGLVCHMTQKRCEKNGCLWSPDFFFSCHAQARDSAKKGFLVINLVRTLSCLPRKLKVKIIMIFFCIFCDNFYRVLIRVIIVQEMLIKQVPLVADTWGKLNHLPMDTKNLFYIFFLLLFFLSAFKFYVTPLNK